MLLSVIRLESNFEEWQDVPVNHVSLVEGTTRECEPSEPATWCGRLKLSHQPQLRLNSLRSS